MGGKEKMQNSIVKNSLVIGIIFLFIGISIAPSVTSIDISKHRTSSDDIEDCGCEENNRISPVRVNYLLKRLEFGTKILISRYGHIPEVNEKGEELLDIIHTIYYDFPIICKIIVPIFEILWELEQWTISVCEKLEDNQILLDIFLYLSTLTISLPYFIFYFLALLFNCVEPPFPSN